MEQWDESKHPRDDDGKFTTGEGTVAEKMKLKEMGIDINDDNLSAEEKKLKDLGIDIEKRVDKFNNMVYTKINANGRPLKDFRSLNKILESDNLDEMIQKSKFAFFSKGREDLIIKPMIAELGFDKPPQKVNAQTFEKLKQTNKILYRGLTKPEFVDEYCNGEMFVGLGINGTGVYTTVEQSRAREYAKETSGILEMALDKDAKIADGFDLRRQAKELLFSLQSGEDISGNPFDCGLDPEKLIKVGEGSNKRFVTMLALAQGYDAIEVGNGDFIILNRTATIVKGESNA